MGMLKKRGFMREELRARSKLEYRRYGNSEISREFLWCSKEKLIRLSKVLNEDEKLKSSSWISRSKSGEILSK